MNCPLCRKPADPAHKPFCSKRCADLDLNRWLSENYRIPIEEEPANDADPAPNSLRD
jgi:endogenous inhibitor of DNA gyrase (YacG/DUF329 family)